MSERRFLSRERLARMTIEKRDKLPDFDLDGARMMWAGIGYIEVCRADGTEAIFVSAERNKPDGMEDWDDQP